jgi:hypothetical protein
VTWNKDVAKKRFTPTTNFTSLSPSLTSAPPRWTALYKSYKEALVLASKANSCAGATAQQILTNTTSLLVLQLKKCPSFTQFHEIFGETPNVKPVHPQEIGGQDEDEADDDGVPDSQEDCIPLPDAAVSARACGGAISGGGAVVKAAAGGPAAAAAGKAPAPFHLAPSKKEKKMDLGEAYLKAQQTRIESVAVTAQAKTRCDLVIALTLQGKTAEEIAEFLVLLGI